MRARRLFVLLLITAVASLSVTSTQLASPTPQSGTIPMLPGTTQPLNTGPGNQVNPHLACGLASFTNDDLEGSSTIRYVDFATNTEHVLPVNGFDRLSDTDGQKIVFTELGANGDEVVVYDIASQTTTRVPGTTNADPAIGGNLVAFVHGRSISSLEIGVYDQNTGTTTQLTSDGLLNRDPAVSPDGKTVVWEKCQGNGTGCDIYEATQTGPGAFTTRRLTDAGEDRFADTNGQVITYLSDKSGETDVYIQRVDGSNEMHIALPGDQRDVRISGNLIVFESEVAAGSYDVFLYDLSSARLYQVTNTPDRAGNETLSDVVAGCNGTNRIVYAIPGTFGDFDVYTFTFQLNDSVNDQINDLIALVQSFNLHDGTEASLISKLQDALAALNASNTPVACDSLTAFINASQAQSGKKLTTGQATQLIDAAALIKTDLGCQ